MIKDTIGSAFVWMCMIMTAFIVYIIFAGTYDVMKEFMIYSHTVNPVDEMRDWFELIYDYFPLWVLIGLTIYGLSRSQKEN